MKESDPTQRLECLLHHNMSIVGGYLGGYAILTRADHFGNAQTTNLLSLLFGILGGDPVSVLLHLGALALYVGGAVLYVVVKNKTRVSPQYLALGIDAAAMLILGLLPAVTDAFLALYPIFFAMSFQWNAFSGACGYASACIFSTNNTRQASLALTEYACNGDAAQLKKGLFYLRTLLCFHIGAACAWFTTGALGVRAAWCGWLLLIPATCLLGRRDVLSRH